MATDARPTEDWIDTLRVRLNEDFEAQTAHLQQLLADGSDPEEAHTQGALIAAARQSLAHITDALRRIDAGDYGDCDRCGRAIPRERLEALPHARFCVPCQQRQAG